MQTTLEKPSTLQRRLTVAVPEERIATEIQSRLENLRRTVRIDGFRQGKAPLKVVRNRFGSRLRDEIVGELLKSTFIEAMGKEVLTPAGKPVIDPISSPPGEGLTYTATFEIYPEIELAQLDELEVEKPVCDIGDDDLNAMIEKLREQNKTWHAVDRAAADGDQLNINFVGTIDGKAFDDGSGEDFDLVLGDGMMIAGFEEGLIGHVAGDDVELELQFPGHYRAEGLAGKQVRFEIRLNSVNESVLPQVDEEFIKQFGGTAGDVEAFRTEVRENMEKERDSAVKRRFNAQVLEKITVANNFEVPGALVDTEMDRLEQQMRRELAARGITVPESAEEISMEVKARAINRVKLGLIMAEIIRKAELRADPQKVRSMIEGMATSFEDPAAVVKWYYDNPEQLSQVESLCLEDEAVTWIVERATVHDVSLSFDALMDTVQTEPRS